MPNPLLLFRVGHMASYDGPGDIHGGGAHVVENGTGGRYGTSRLSGAGASATSCRARSPGSTSHAWRNPPALGGRRATSFRAWTSASSRGRPAVHPRRSWGAISAPRFSIGATADGPTPSRAAGNSSTHAKSTPTTRSSCPSRIGRRSSPMPRWTGADTRSSPTSGTETARRRLARDSRPRCGPTFDHSAKRVVADRQKGNGEVARTGPTRT